MSRDKTSDPSIFGQTLSLNHSEPAAKTDWSAFMAVVKSRRSVRVFTKEAIPEVIVRECLAAALLAPNSSNLQPWEFYWVRSPEKKSRLVKACLSQPAASTAQELIVCVARIDTWKRNRGELLKIFEADKTIPPAVLDYYRRLVPIAYSLGFLGLYGLLKRIAVMFLGLKNPTPREPVSKSDLWLWSVKTCALACQNLMLAFRAQGFDSCPMEGMDSKRIRQILDLPRGAKVVMVISAGRRAENGVYGPQLRLGAENFLFEV